MAVELPYLPSYKNVGKLFEKIASAKIPDSFTHSHLTNTLGLKSVGDRPLIPMLKKLGFVDQSGKPTEKYGLLKNKATSGVAIAAGIRKAYEPLFEANEQVYELNFEQLRGLISQVAGTDDKFTKSIAYTFAALVKHADFSKQTQSQKEDEVKVKEVDEISEVIKSKSQKHDFHFNVQVHLPSNGSEETYLNIFNAMRKVFN